MIGHASPMVTARRARDGSRRAVAATAAIAICASALVGPAAAGATGGHQFEFACPLTLPNGQGSGVTNFGNGALSVGLSRTGMYDALTFYDDNHGQLSIKFPWERWVAGKLRISAHRLDAAAPSARARVPSGYGNIGFQASGVVFPTVGCWQVTGSVGDASLTFVIQIVGKIPVARAVIASTVVRGSTAAVRWKGNAAAVYYDVEVRSVGGRWRFVSRTTVTRYSLQRTAGRRIDARVCALDKWFVPGPCSRPARIIFA